MFDLGTRKDYWNLAPAVQRVFGTDSVMTGMRIDKDVTDVLTDGGVQLNEIDSCIWSVSIDGKPAQDPLIEGFWRDEKLWDYGAFKKTLNIPPL
ncbi:unnamed protein product [Penicillium pancosmium]